MKDDSVFEQCRTSNEIQNQLQILVKELLTTIRPQEETPGDSLRATTGDWESIDLSILPELSYAELKHHQRPVALLSEICRLLIKLGDRKSLQLCLTLSHRIYSFKCQHDESRRISSLYKGVAQIGLHLAELGIKNVLNAISPHNHFSLAPTDYSLSYWALMSAAILNRNLKLASTFVLKWENIAQEGGLKREVFRANIVRHLLYLLLDDIKACSHSISRLIHETPEEWGDTVAFLEEWTKSLQNGRCVAITKFSEPYPLFLGIPWHHYSPAPLLSTNFKQTPQPAMERKHIAEDFSFLCEVRRNFCNEKTRNHLSIEDIEKYATCLARWELPRPLYDFETILKNKAAEKNLHYIMSRLLGKRVLEAVISKTPLDPDVVTHDNAIILVMDVRKFSALSENRTPDEIFSILNPIFKIMNEELEQAGGTILEFVGDCIIIVFNIFKNRQADITDILRRTIQALQRIHVLNAMSFQAGLPEIQIGVGINKGKVALGYLGGLDRCHLTVLGNTINLAARIESSTKELPGAVVMSEFCFEGETPDVWTTPLNLNFSVRDLGKHTMRNIKEPVHLFGLSPLRRYWIDFVPMGFVASPEKGVVYIDTGNSSEPGIIDHHYKKQIANSACELLNRQPAQLFGHLEGIPLSQIEFRLHRNPDLDCAATLYTAYELLEKRPRKEILLTLAVYVSRIDQGLIPQSQELSNSLYGVFIAHQKIVEQKYERDLTDFLILEAELRVIDAAVYLMEQHMSEGNFASIFRFQPDWFAEERHLIKEDRERYQEDLAKRSHTYTAHINGLSQPATGLWLDHPQSIFFKLWLQSDPDAPGGKGYQFLTLDLSQSEKNRFIIRLDPESGTNLNGLGQLLELHESRKRKEQGQERPIQPIRYPSDNSDPWYFGQGHNYTIIDSPWEGTLLTAKEVQQIHEHWESE